MRNSKVWIILLTAITGCSVGPRYHEPTLSLPEKFESAPSFKQEEVAELTSWWTQFNDPLLNVFIHEAISENLSLKQAIEKLCESRALYQVKTAELAPKIDLVAKERRSRISQSLFDSRVLGPPTQNFYEIGFDASWEIDIFGKNRREAEAARCRFGADEDAARDVYITLLSDVARTYIDIRTFQKQIHLTRRNIYVHEELLSLNQSLLDAGLESDIKPEETKASLINLKTKLPPLQISLQEKIHALAVLLGKTPESFGKEVEKISLIPTAKLGLSVGMPSELLRRRPDIRRAEQMLAASTAAAKSAVADLFPRFFLLGGYGHQSNESNQWLHSKSRSWTFGPDFQWPIIHFGRIRQNIKAKDSAHKQAFLKYEETILNALKEVENSLVNYSQEEEKKELFQKEQETKKKLYSYKRDLYLSGLANFQTFLMAERDLLETELHLAMATGELSTKLVSLYKALGGDW